MPTDVPPDPAVRWRAWATTAALVLASFAGGLALLAVLHRAPHGPGRVADVVVGALACLALGWRGRAPVVVGAALAVVAAFVATGGVANMVALFFVARLRRLPVALAVAVADVVAGWVFWELHPGNDGLSLTLTVNLAIAAAVTAWGALLQSQRALLDVYRERAERAEEEKRLREDRIRAHERTRIAREMHDVVAHRISLVALHAGGLEVAPQQGPDDVRRAAELIRGSAVQALDELRSAIGLLRADEPRSLEQPGLDRLDDLVEEARAAGQPVELSLDLGEPEDGEQRPAVGRDVFRIVQEGLTNARKHAPGARVDVRVTREHDCVAVVVTNPVTAASLGVPGSHSGLIGLSERAAQAGGTLDHRTTPEGRFELRARLPWR